MTERDVVGRYASGYVILRELTGFTNLITGFATSAIAGTGALTPEESVRRLREYAPRRLEQLLSSLEDHAQDYPDRAWQDGSRDVKSGSG